MSRGVVILGVNNARINYAQLAVMAAAFVKKNMPGTSTCLITNDESLEVYDGSRYPLTRYFNEVVKIPKNFKEIFSNKRSYRDTRYYSVEDKFRNEARSMVYELTPYDETLLIDSDFMVCNNSLSALWGCQDDVAMSNKAISLLHKRIEGNEGRLNPFGISMYWATIVYFKKSEKARILFNLVEHIKENWDFYKLTYDFPGSMFRNDYAFSIAIHILSGFMENDDFVAPLPDSPILTALDIDQFYKIHSANEMTFFVNNREENWKFYASRIKGLNVHCMNKLSIINQLDDIMEHVK